MIDFFYFSHFSFFWLFPFFIHWKLCLQDNLFKDYICIPKRNWHFCLLQNVIFILHIYVCYSRIQSTNLKLIFSSWLEFEPFVVKLVVHNLGRHFNLQQTITLNPRLWLCPDLNLYYPRSLLFNPWLSAFSFLDTVAVSEDKSMFKIRFSILDL